MLALCTCDPQLKRLNDLAMVAKAVEDDRLFREEKLQRRMDKAQRELHKQQQQHQASSS
jgi:hypothetical protein